MTRAWSGNSACTPGAAPGPVNNFNGVLVTDGMLYTSSAHNKKDNAYPVLFALQAGGGVKAE